jgi:HEAT repeat protein
MRLLLVRMAGVFLVVSGIAGAGAAQTTAAGPPSRATLIGRGWTAIGAGRPAEAEKIADGILAGSPRNHDAVALKIEARAAGGRAIPALDAYEQWQSAVRQEDPFIMAPIAVGLLRTASTTDGDLRAKFRALELLAGAGDATARQALATAATNSFMEADAALLRLGDAEAAARLERRIEAPSARDKSDLIDALRKAKSKRSAGAITRALQDPAMPTRMAAARALGDLGARDSIPQLVQVLKDPEPPVRFMAAVALAKLGSTAGDNLIRQLENSPVGDMRMLAAEVTAPGSPSGPWVAEATRVLQDPDPLARLRAAELLVRHAADPSAGLEALRVALAENNPAIRFAAADLLEDLPRSPIAEDLPSVRRLLRDPSAPVRVEAAGILLRLSAADLR